MPSQHECEQAPAIQSIASNQLALRKDHERSQEEFGALVTELAKLNVATDRFTTAMTMAKKDAQDSLKVSKATLDKVLELDSRVGTAPNEVSGSQGTGLTGIVVRMSKEVNAATLSLQRLTERQQDSLHDIERLQDESEVTQIQSRTELIHRARESEQARKEAFDELRLMTREKQLEKENADKVFRQRVIQILIYLVVGASGGGTVSELLKSLLQ